MAPIQMWNAVYLDFSDHLGCPLTKNKCQHLPLFRQGVRAAQPGLWYKLLIYILYTIHIYIFFRVYCMILLTILLKIILYYIIKNIYINIVLLTLFEKNKDELFYLLILCFIHPIYRNK